MLQQSQYLGESHHKSVCAQLAKSQNQHPDVRIRPFEFPFLGYRVDVLDEPCLDNYRIVRIAQYLGLFHQMNLLS